MKTLITVIALFAATATTGFSKAYFQGESEMVENATAIVVVDLSEPKVSELKGKTWTYRQTASAKVIQRLKGDVPDTFNLYGGETFICAQCALKSGRYLAFLRQDGDLWVGANWHLSLRPLKDGQVEWFAKSDQIQPLNFQSLDSVLTRIQKILESRVKSTNKQTKG